MGTPEFAVPSLHAIDRMGHELVAVYCQPDRPRGRSKRPQPCPVKQAATSLGVPLRQPQRLKGAAQVDALRADRPDVVVVAAYGQILRKSILDLPPLGCINVHASLLPRWRGASPVHHAILAGDTQTGVSIMAMTRGLDAGPVYAQQAVELTPGVRRSELEHTLADLGARLLTSTLPDLASMTPVLQDETRVTYAPMITKDMGDIDFVESAFEIERKIRAFETWPGVSCRYRDEIVKFLDARAEPLEGQAPAGEVLKADKQAIWVGCGQNSQLAVTRVQIAGKKPTDIASFANGYRVKPGDQFRCMDSR